VSKSPSATLRLADCSRDSPVNCDTERTNIADTAHDSCGYESRVAVRVVGRAYVAVPLRGPPISKPRSQPSHGSSAIPPCSGQHDESSIASC
jgi:hypothetical protein